MIMKFNGKIFSNYKYEIQAYSDTVSFTVSKKCTSAHLLYDLSFKKFHLIVVWQLKFQISNKGWRINLIRIINVMDCIAKCWT